MNKGHNVKMKILQFPTLNGCQWMSFFDYIEKYFHDGCFKPMVDIKKIATLETLPF